LSRRERNLDERERDYYRKENKGMSTAAKIGIIIAIIFLIFIIMGLFMLNDISSGITESNDISEENQGKNSPEIIVIIEEKVKYIKEIIYNFIYQNDDKIESAREYGEKNIGGFEKYANSSGISYTNLI
jgi:predicted PurR-regulated permease PerM